MIKIAKNWNGKFFIYRNTSSSEYKGNKRKFKYFHKNGKWNYVAPILTTEQWGTIEEAELALNNWFHKHPKEFAKYIAYKMLKEA